MSNLGIIGCGLTGAAVAYLLKQSYPSLNITILEKAKGVGGRMCTSRSPDNDSCTVDLGAQYITKSDNLTNYQQECYKKLTSKGLLKEMAGDVKGMHASQQNKEHYICPKGSGSLVKYFIESCNPHVHFQKRVVELEASSDRKYWIIKTESSTMHEFNFVVSTIPAPQVLEIIMKPMDILDPTGIQNLKKVKYNSRFALGLFYNRDELSTNGNEVAAYILDNPILRFISFDARKRGLHSSNQSVVVHSTKEFGKANLEKEKHEVKDTLLAEVKKNFPYLPLPTTIKPHKWRYSQVEEGYPNQPGCITLCKEPLLICGGDSFSSSNFEGCIYSAETIYKTIVDQL